METKQFMKNTPKIPVRIINTECSVFCDLCRSTMTRKPFWFGKRSCDNVDCDSNIITQIKESQQGIDYVNSLVPKNEIGLSWEIAKRAIKNNIPNTAKRYKIINAFEKFLFAVFAMGVIFYVCFCLWWFNY